MSANQFVKDHIYNKNKILQRTIYVKLIQCSQNHLFNKFVVYLFLNFCSLIRFQLKKFFENLNDKQTLLMILQCKFNLMQKQFTQVKVQLLKMFVFLWNALYLNCPGLLFTALFQQLLLQFYLMWPKNSNALFSFRITIIVEHFASLKYKPKMHTYILTDAFGDVQLRISYRIQHPLKSTYYWHKTCDAKDKKCSQQCMFIGMKHLASRLELQQEKQGWSLLQPSQQYLTKNFMFISELEFSSQGDSQPGCYIVLGSRYSELVEIVPQYWTEM
ncbi:unnamed protein product [Paramecium octaurelia]|uniref:Transmembrane protein n=1 Tax=Paramecium octaurelia TaxID=43137 RepID=A0A8S1T0S5_PAROT|nr:unnamed protein product [Paramecium octaurelia]